MSLIDRLLAVCLSIVLWKLIDPLLAFEWGFIGDKGSCRRQAIHLARDSNRNPKFKYIAGKCAHGKYLKATSDCPPMAGQKRRSPGEPAQLLHTDAPATPPARATEKVKVIVVVVVAGDCGHNLQVAGAYQLAAVQLPPVASASSFCSSAPHLFRRTLICAVP